jgi:hypothetical protein
MIARRGSRRLGRRDGVRLRGRVPWYLLELLRIKDEVLLQQAEAADQSAQPAEDSPNQGGEKAHEQDALFWELRMSLDFARLRVSKVRHHEARASLKSVYDRFTDGFMSADLEVRRLIATRRAI